MKKFFIGALLSTLLIGTVCAAESSGAALTVLNFFGNREFDEASLSKALKSKPKIGTSLDNMVKFFRAIGWHVQSSFDAPPMDEKTVATPKSN